MTSWIYFNFRLIIAGMLLVLGVCLVWGIIPSKLRGSIFDDSRKCVGLAIMVMPLSTFFVYFLSLRSLMYNLHIVSYLTACYTISILVTVGFVPLLGGDLNFTHKRFISRFIRGLIGIPFFAAPMLIANMYGDQSAADMAKFVTIALLMTAISCQCYTFIKLYRKAIQRGNNYYSDDIEVDINWIIKSVFALFALEIVCAISSLFSAMSYTAEIMLTIYRVATLVYVFVQFVRFMANFEGMMRVCENPQIDEVDLSVGESRNKTLSEDQLLQIAKRLEVWIDKGGYTVCGVTVDDVAKEVATNRTYFSIYINTVFGCSFRVWITSLRVELAKQLLMGEDSIVEIAQNIGFSSPQSFMHCFKRNEGCTPTQWREANIQYKCSNEPFV